MRWGFGLLEIASRLLPFAIIFSRKEPSEPRWHSLKASIRAEGSAGKESRNCCRRKVEWCSVPTLSARQPTARGLSLLHDS